MERKLSAKASKMRNRLNFSRSTSAQGRMSTLVSPIAGSPASSRPRSATNPESPTHDEPMWDNSDANSSRGYNFSDESGYFRPSSPYIDRQEVHEDLEADIKHACALLSHSIDRGIPAGLSYQSAIPTWTGQNEPAGQPSAEIASSMEQHIIVFSLPKPNDPEAESNKKHDSGVGMSFNSPTQPGRPYVNSVSGTVSSARFYNKQSSLSPPGSPLQDRTRSRSPTLAESIQPEGAREFSFCSSPVPFQYSPPPAHGEWPSDENTLKSPVSPLNETDKKLYATESQSILQFSDPTNGKAIDTSSPAISPTEEPCLGEEGRTWLRASKDIQYLAEEENAKAAKAKATKTSSRFYSGRFYSGNSQTAKPFNSRERLAKNFWEDRDLSFYGQFPLVSSLELAMGSRPSTATSRLGSSSSNEEELPSTYPYATRGISYSSSCLRDEFKHQENVYLTVVPSCAPQKRRKKASLLLRKLAGLGMRRREEREA